MSRGWGQTLFSDAQRQDNRQWAQIEAQEVPSEHEVELLWVWQSTGTGCPEGLWSLLLWRYSKPAWTWSCATWSRWICFGSGVGLGDLQRSLPTPTILWFSEKYYKTLGNSTGKGEYILICPNPHHDYERKLKWSKRRVEKNNRYFEKDTCFLSGKKRRKKIKKNNFSLQKDKVLYTKFWSRLFC